MQLQLPAWAHQRPGTKTIDVVADDAYAEWLKRLGVEDGVEPTQYQLECAYQCIKMDVEAATGGAGAGQIIILHYSAEGKAKYRQKDKAPGRKIKKRVRGIVQELVGADAASKGGEARLHYKRIRGFLPA